MQIDTLIKNVLSNESNETTTDDSIGQKETVQVGTIGWWKGVLDEERVGVLVEESTLQLYKLSRHGFKPFGLPVDVKDWVLKEMLLDYQYVVKGIDIFLVI